MHLSFVISSDLQKGLGNRILCLDMGRGWMYSSVGEIEPRMNWRHLPKMEIRRQIPLQPQPGLRIYHRYEYTQQAEVTTSPRSSSRQASLMPKWVNRFKAVVSCRKEPCSNLSPREQQLQRPKQPSICFYRRIRQSLDGFPGGCYPRRLGTGGGKTTITAQLKGLVCLIGRAFEGPSSGDRQ